MKQVDLYGRVRHAVLVDGVSSREAARVFGIDPRTVSKMLAFSVPPGYVHEVVIACGAEVIARHPRSWEKEDYIYNPLHYLALSSAGSPGINSTSTMHYSQHTKSIASIRHRGDKGIIDTLVTSFDNLVTKLALHLHVFK